ncbi:MAG: GNAT family N-acetyltransferase [Verrucomicrobia bacterium]|nr:GNAT family N-acetyltransferase [Verrucomicrobiota bacterium]
MISWICFEWKTSGLPKDGVSFEPFVIRAAEKSEQESVAKSIKSAFSMDSVWGDVSRPLAEKIAAGIEAAFLLPEPSCVVLAHGSRVIGASVLDGSPDATNHLSSGPCILHEYRNRGLASGLLAASLAFLQKKEIAVARGLTRANSITARFIYPKFGGVSHPIEGDPLKPKAD